MPAGVVRPNADIEPVVGIQFGIFSPDEIERRSVVEITNSGTYDGNEPRIGGLFDPRMGVLDNGKTCRSCGQTNHSCPGHFGHFKLARPVYFIQFFDQLKSVLNCVCIKCSKLLIDKGLHKEIHKRRGEPRWRATLAACQNIGRCGQETEDGCGARQPDRYVRDGIATIVAEWDAIEGPAATGEGGAPAPTKQRQRLEVEYVLRLLRRITDEDVDFMGFSRYFCRPDWMICTVLPIPPPQVRPSVIQDNNQRSEDDLTHKLFEIIMTNQRLQDKINNNAEKRLVEDEHMALQYHIATLVDNQIPGVAPSAQRSGRPLKSVKQRLGSKEGRIRYNIQGKRVEFSARSVITPDPNISIGELGVPMKIAMNLTFPEKVTPYNKDLMYRLVQNGPDKFPGAKTIVRSDGRMISLKHVNTKEIVLHTGDVVNRHLNDGDIVLFNRQPTLHRMSMMGHRVKVLPYNTFRLNVSVTAPYNADFDGDEMNAHIPQSYEAATELAEIAAVPHQIVTPRHAKPVIGIVQDTLVGSYRITRPTVNFNRRQYMNMMMWNKRFEGKVPTGKTVSETGAPRYNGQQILSELLPPVNMEMGNDSYKDDKRQENMVKIREGEVLQGIFDKGIFSKPSKGIIHTLFKDYGSTDTVQFIDSMQNTIEQFLVYNGFSVGISDLIADEETRKQMEEVIKKRKTAVENILLQIHMDLFDNNTGKTNQQEFEDKVFVELNKATDEAGKAGLGSLADENRLIAMVKAGSKGSNINIAQMMACVGQQAPEGRRIPYGFTDRTLPHYKKYDDGAEARGFVESSFIKGLTPQEFFFHAMSGREGLIDTAVKTADTGYIQRQLVKAMEDLVVQYDGTVRDSRGNIFQFYYGEDGINATKIESVGLGVGKLSEEEIKKTYGMEGVELATVLAEGTLRGEDAAAMEAFVEQVLEDRRMLVEDIQKSKQDAPLFASVNVERILTNVATSFRLDAESKTDLTPLYVLQGIERLIRKTQGYHRLWAAVLRFYLAPHRLIVKERFTRRAFDTACEMILVKNYQSWVQPGEQVGIIAAQSIGEPSTQMSAHKDTWVHIQAADGAHFCGRIADFVDRLLEQNPAAVKAVPGHADSVVMDLPAAGYSIIGVSTDEKTSWRPISQISRHPANGGLVKVVTKSGRSTTATLSHSFLKRTEKGVAPILGSELEVGMRIPVATYIPEMPTASTGRDGFALTADFGWVCGIYLADGSIHGNQVRITKAATEVEESIRAVGAAYGWEITAKDYQTEQGLLRETLISSADLKNFLQTHFGSGATKAVGPAVFSMCREFQQGVVGGYFDGDGNVNPDRQQIRAGSRSADLIRSMNRLLGYCGYFGVINEESTVNLPGKIMYTVNILKKYAAKFQAEIGFRLREKAAALDEIVAYCARENKHDTKELYDKIPEVGNLIAEVGKALDIPGHSRTYGRWTKKESIGRLTLASYVDTFKARAGKSLVAADEIARLDAAVRADVLWDEITELVYLPDPNEFVYDFTVPGNDSFMVDDMILVHNTLNSVDWDTEILIAKDGQIQAPKIGEFVDNYYKACDQSKVQNLPNGQIYIPLEDGHNWQAVSCDEDGKVKWTKLEAITRHPVVNEDGTNTILKVTLESGREVKATKGRSFLTLVDGKVRDVNGSDLKVGDVLPVATALAVESVGVIKTLPLRDLLPPTENLYGTDARAALACMEAADGAGQRHWFQANQGSTFTVPYSRSDSFREAIGKGRNTNADAIRSGFVYPARTRPEVSQIPESIPLTEEFGFFVGAYLAEGMANATQIHITNNDVTYLAKVKAQMDAWNVGTHLSAEKRQAAKSGIAGTSTSLIVHSTLLAKVMTTLFGRTSYEKTMPDWVLQAPAEFVAGLVDAYVSGDGTVSKRDGIITMSSVSDALITRMGALFARFGIFSVRSKYMPDQGKFDKVHEQHTLRLPALYSQVFAKTFRLSLKEKQARLETHFLGANAQQRTCRRDTMNDMVWDKIKTIEEVVPMGEGWVYDMTVADTKNFMTLSCVAVRDTFHLAGVAAKSNVTRGVPRLKELLKVTQNPKAISLTVPLKPEFRGSREKAREVAQDLELTLLKDIAIKTAIYFDPDDETSVVEEDRDLLKFYHLFEAAQNETEEDEAAAAAAAADGEDAEAEPKTWSGWLLRFELDREHMFRKNITMDDVGFVIRSRFGSQVNLIYSDYNSSKLVMRMRLPDLMKGGLDDLVNLKKFQTRILNGIVFRGVPGIKSVTFREDKDTLELNKETGKYEQVTQYVLDTDGSNFLAVMRHPYVDARRLASSHVHDIYEVLGIEATRQTLLNEITTLFEEAGVNNRHLGLLCDVMTNAGRLMSADRHGINKTDIGPLAKASFEETERILLNAALYGETDPVTGVSANIMMGQPIRGGTGFFNVLLDEGAFLRLQEGLPPAEGYDDEELDEPTQEQIDQELYEDENDLCSSARLRMNVAMPNAPALLEEEDVEIALLDREEDE